MQGLSTQQMARELVLSPHTVQDHLKSVFAKTGVNSRSELVGQIFLEHYAPRWEDVTGVPAGWIAKASPVPAGRRPGHNQAMSYLPDGPRRPRMVQAWFWLKRPVWFLERCWRTYGDVFTMRMPFSTDLVHVADPELVKAVFGGDHEVLRAGEANGMFLEPLVGPHSVLVLDGPEHLRQRKLILPAFHGDRMRAWEATIRDITRAEIARWPEGRPFALRPSMQSITLDVIIRVVFGVDGSARADDLRRRIVTVIRIGRNPFLLLATRDRRLGPRAPWAAVCPGPG